MGKRTDTIGMPGRKKKVSDRELIDIVRARENPVITTAEVAEQVSLTHGSTRRRLVELRDDPDSEVIRVEMGGGATGHAWLTTSEPESALEIQRVVNRVPELNDSVCQLELPGTDVVLELRRATVQMAYDYAEDNVEKSLEEITDYLMRRNPAGFRYQRTALRDMVLESMRTLDGVRVKEDGDRVFIER